MFLLTIKPILGFGFASSVGWLFLAGLGIHVALQIVGQIRRIEGEKEQRRLAREKLEWDIKAAQAKHVEVAQSVSAWNGYRKFKVANKQYECQGVYSFYLVPHDGRPLPPYKPGQYLTFQLSIPGREKPIIRCYSLSDSPFHTNYYRVTIKREEAPKDRPDLQPGVASSYFVDKVKQGDILDVKAPTGHFFLDLNQPKPIVLISGGVGITPMLSMMNAIIESGTKRDVWFFYGSRNRAEHIQRSYLLELAGMHDNIHIHVCYSQPNETDAFGRDYHHKGRVTVELLKQLLPSNNFEYFLCGNGAFMKSISDGLEAWGVPESSVHFEAFGPATVKKKAAPEPNLMTLQGPQPQVTFRKSGKTMPWEPRALNLLDFARDKGVRLESGCCAGSCGSCLVAIQSGEVEYLTAPDTQPEDGSCLACICRPKGDVVLDA